MKKTVLPLLLSLLLLLASCGAPVAAREEETLHVQATTYPVYLFATAVADGVEGVEVTLLVNQQTACLHDYTLTVPDMKAIESADVIAMNGAGLEDFMDDALAASQAPAIDCSQGITLLPYVGHEGHDHGEAESESAHFDPHIWMSPANAEIMLDNLASGLSALDPDHEAQYSDNLDRAVAALWDGIDPEGGFLAAPQVCKLITFHDGFQYFADYFGFDLVKSIEEEEGSEASAAEIKEIVGLIREYHIPAIFTEINGSDATAQAIARETGVAVYPLNMIMSGDGDGVGLYAQAITHNYTVLRDAFTGAAG